MPAVRGYSIPRAGPQLVHAHRHDARPHRRGHAESCSLAPACCPLHVTPLAASTCPAACEQVGWLRIVARTLRDRPRVTGPLGRWTSESRPSQRRGCGECRVRGGWPGRDRWREARKRRQRNRRRDAAAPQHRSALQRQRQPLSDGHVISKLRVDQHRRPQSLSGRRFACV
jgi:hypothetical protein